MIASDIRSALGKLVPVITSRRLDSVGDVGQKAGGMVRSRAFGVSADSAIQ